MQRPLEKRIGRKEKEGRKIEKRISLSLKRKSQ